MDGFPGLVLTNHKAEADIECLQTIVDWLVLFDTINLNYPGDRTFVWSHWKDTLLSFIDVNQQREIKTRVQDNNQRREQAKGIL